MVTETITSVKKAKEIAVAAKGAYWEGAAVPTLKGTEIALPVIDQAGNVIGHIVAFLFQT
jgi:hypothetical protein